MSDTKLLMEQHKRFYRSGSTLNVDYRINALMKLKENVIAYEDKIAHALYQDLGKSVHETLTTEIGQVTSEIKALIKLLKKMKRRNRKTTNMVNLPSKSYTIKEPYGTVLVISPWNYPFQLAMAPIAGAIAGGNTIVLKPSEISSHTSELLQTLLDETFDDGLVSVVQGGVDETTALLEERFDKIFFTGSPKVGSIIMEKAAKHLTPVVLELGGKSPCVVDKNTNIITAARRIVFGKASNSGQTCVAPDYLLLHEDIKDSFYEAFKQVAEEFYAHEFELNKDYGRMINERNYERVASFLKDGLIVYGGGHSKDSLHIDLTLLELSSLDVSVMGEEIFGPVLPVVVYSDLDEAMAVIERNPDPLALYVFSDNNHVVDTLLHKVRFGGGCVNDTLMHLSNDNLPFGGRGTSGMGNYHGKYSIDAFTHEKAILHSSMGFDLKIKYPPFKKENIPVLKWLLY